MATKKYVSLSKLSTFLDNLKSVFASKIEFDEIKNTKADTNHLHDISDIADLQPTIDEMNDNISQKSQVQMIVSDNTEDTNITEVLSTLKIHKLTQEQYDEAVINGTLDNNALYLTPEEEIDLSGYATVGQLSGKADIDHNHNDVYYTETEVDALLFSKSDTSHNHDNTYDAKGSADNALASAKSYADNAANTVKSDLLNGAGGAYDTLKELGDLINENVDAIEALEIVASSKADADHTHNDIYYTEMEIDDKVSTINNSITTSLNQAKSYSDTNLNAAKTYANNVVAQKTQVQIITWEDDD